MKPKLEARQHSLLGHLIQFRGLIARQARVVGIIRIWFQQRRRVAAQRAIHEALQHSGVQHQIRLRMRVALLLQLLDGLVERQPLGDARCQLAVFFEFLVNLEILPIRRIILRRSHAVLGKVRQRDFNSLPPCLVCRLRNYCSHRPLRRVAQNPRWLPVGIAINLSPLRVAAGNRDARQLQRARVCHRKMPVHPIQNDSDARPKPHPDPSGWAAPSPPT